MKRVFSLLVVLLCLFSMAYAEGKLSTTQKNLIVFENDDNAYFYAKIENTGDKPIGVGSGTLVAFTEDDEILLTENYITSCPNNIMLEPGEYIYAREYIWDSALETETVADYKFSVESRNNGYNIEKIPCEVSYEINGSDSYDNYIYVTFTNITEEPKYGFYIAVALLDADGNILFVNSDSANAIAIHSGSSVTVKVSIDKDLVEYYEKNSLVPEKAEAMVCYEKD